MLMKGEMFALAGGTVILVRSGGGFDGGDSFAQGVFRELGYAVGPEFFHHPAAVGFDGLGTDADRGGDLLGALAVGDLAEDLLFACGEGERAGSGGLVLKDITADDSLCDVRTEVDLVGGDGADREEQFAGGAVL